MLYLTYYALIARHNIANPTCLWVYGGRNCKVTFSILQSQNSKMEFEFSNDMDEISGFGGKYEETCRRLVCKGAKLIHDEPALNPKYIDHGNFNPDMKKLLSYITQDDLSCNMVDAAINHILFIKSNGWNNYCKHMKERKN